jgi:hypothetical protein
MENTKKLSKARNFNIDKGMLVVYILVPISIFLLPMNFFDSDTTVVCLSRLLLDMECWGCGLTRSVMHALHCDFIGAWGYNKLIVVVLPLLIAVWAKNLWKILKRLGWVPKS